MNLKQSLVLVSSMTFIGNVTPLAAQVIDADVPGASAGVPPIVTIERELDITTMRQAVLAGLGPLGLILERVMQEQEAQLSEDLARARAQGIVEGVQIVADPLQRAELEQYRQGLSQSK